MSIDDNLQVVLQTPTHNLLDTRHPGFVDAHGGRIGDMMLPAHGDADGIEARSLNGFNGFLRYNRIVPRRLRLDTVGRHAYEQRFAIQPWGRTLKLVSQVPAHHTSIPLFCRGLGMAGCHSNKNKYR